MALLKGRPADQQGHAHQKDRIKANVEVEEAFDAQPLEVKVGLSHGAAEQALLAAGEELGDDGHLLRGDIFWLSPLLLLCLLLLKHAIHLAGQRLDSWILCHGALQQLEVVDEEQVLAAQILVVLLNLSVEQGARVLRIGLQKDLQQGLPLI